MGRDRFVLGKSKIVTKGNHWIFSKDDILYTSSNKIEEVGVENGITIGNKIEKIVLTNPLSEFIETAYWIDKKNNKTNLMEIDSNIIQFYIKFTSEAKGKSFSITIRSLDSVIDDDLSEETDFVVEKENAYFKFNLNARNFQKGEDAKQKLYFYVKIKGAAVSKYPLSKEDYLKVHVVRYIPQVMRAKSPPWEIAVKCQEEWFKKEKKQKPNYSDPVTNIITMDWIFKFERVHPLLKTIILNYWTTENSIKLFCDRLEEMYSYKEKDSNGIIKRDLELPNIKGQSKEFGSFDNSVFRITKKGIKTTILDRYYINTMYYTSNITNDPLDDLYGALGNFAFRITPKGTITAIGNNKYRIKYEKIAVYCIDSFDFYDPPKDNISQPLGFWDIGNNIISKIPIPMFYYINNQSYKDYQDDYNQGGDYMLISDYEEIDVDFSFNVEHFPNHGNKFLKIN